MNALGFRIGLAVLSAATWVRKRVSDVMEVDPVASVVRVSNPWCMREGGVLISRGAYVDHYDAFDVRRHGSVVAVSSEGAYLFVLRADAEVNGIAAQRMAERWEAGE